MSSSNENFSTPVQRKERKRLGLRLTRSDIKNQLVRFPANSTEDKPNDDEDANHRLTTTHCVQPRSDAKVNYKNLDGDTNWKCQTNSVATTPGTPSTSHLPQKQSVSTNCRPFRLGLCRRVREKMTKKRLEFHVANEMEKNAVEQKRNQQPNSNNEVTHACKSSMLENVDKDSATCYAISTNHQKSDHTNSDNLEEPPPDMSRDKLIAAIEQTRIELKSRQNHSAKVKELQQAILTWQVGFNTSLNDLQQKIQPAPEKETMLQHLCIPQDMMKYVTD